MSIWLLCNFVATQISLNTWSLSLFGIGCCFNSSLSAVKAATIGSSLHCLCLPNFAHWLTFILFSFLGCFLCDIQWGSPPSIVKFTLAGTVVDGPYQARARNAGHAWRSLLHRTLRFWVSRGGANFVFAQVCFVVSTHRVIVGDVASGYAAKSTHRVIVGDVASGYRLELQPQPKSVRGLNWSQLMARSINCGVRPDGGRVSSLD